VSLYRLRPELPDSGTGTTSARKRLTLTNGAPNSLTISSISITGTNLNDFAISKHTCGTALSGNASCTVQVVFKPTSVNNRTATLTFVDSAPGGTQTVALTGVATAVMLAPSSLTFGNQTVGTTSASQAITLTNESGGSTVTITSLTSPAQIPPTSRRPTIAARRCCQSRAASLP